MAKRAVGSHLVVVDRPSLDLGARIVEADEPGLVRARVPELAGEGLDEGVVHRLAGADEVEHDAARYARVSSAGS